MITRRRPPKRSSIRTTPAPDPDRFTRAPEDDAFVRFGDTALLRPFFFLGPESLETLFDEDAPPARDPPESPRATLETGFFLLDAFFAIRVVVAGARHFVSIRTHAVAIYEPRRAPHADHNRTSRNP